MGSGSGAVHVTTQRRHYTGKDGRERVYETHLLRRSWREDGKVRNETVANLSRLPAETIELIRRSLAGERFVPAGAQAQVARSLPHGHAAAVHAMARRLGFPALLGPPCRGRDLAYALVVSRVARPASKLSTAGWWGDVTLGPDLGVAGASTDEVYQAMDWLLERQDAIEAALARRHLRQGGMALFDLSSSWVEGSRCELAAFGHSRDGKRGKPQIEYGLLTSRDGCPVAVRVFPGNTGDPRAFVQAVETVRDKFGITQAVMVGDRGMITSARIKALKEIPGMAWITCLRAPAIKKLAEDGGPLQMSLFDAQDLAEISSPADYPGERLIACHNPVLAEERKAHRERLLSATEAELAKIQQMVQAGRLKDPAKIGIRAGKVINKRKVAKHFIPGIGQGSFTWRRDQASIDAEAAFDGIYIIRTPIPAAQLPAADVVAAYKDLSHIEQDFRISKDDLDLRPIWHRLADRVKAHVLICMLACHLSWHLRKAWAPLTYTDEQPPQRDNPVAPARRSPAADAKAARKTGPGKQPIRGFRGLLDHLATLTRNDLRYGQVTIPALAEPTPTQRRAFDLIGAPIPLTLTNT
jgi:Transposase DDE domain